MGQQNEKTEPANNMERLKEQAAACGPECGCHAAGTSRRARWVLGAIVLLAALALAARAVLKGNGPSAQTSEAAFAAPLCAEKTPAPAAAPSLSPERDPSAAAATVQPTAPAPSGTSATAAPGEPKPGATAAAVGKPIGAFAELNQFAVETNAVFVFLPAKPPEATPLPTAPMQAAAKTIEAQGQKVGLFTLKADSHDYQEITAQTPVPSVLVLVKGRGMSAVSGEITETKLVQGFVAASNASSCGSGSGGCGAASAGCK